MPTKQRPLKVFLCHAHSDKNTVRELYLRLTRDGVDAWLDKEKLLPGQDWELEIRRAVRESDVVVVCLSRQFNQAGFRQKEVRLALDTAMEQPDGEIFIIPAWLDKCDTLESLQKWHRVDLFEEDGYENLIRALRARADKIGAMLDVKKDPLPRAVPPTKRSERGSGRLNTPEEKSVETPSKKDASVGVPAVVKSPAETNEQGSGEDKPKKTSFKMDSTIIAALIGLAGTIIVALITLYANRPDPPLTPTATETITLTSTSTVTYTPAPTGTMTVEPTFTLVPATNTVVSTVTVIPPFELGKDWIAGCISTLWRPYPADVQVTERGDGCWKEPVHVFSAENGDLDFLVQRKNAPSEIYGLFVALPDKGTVTVNVRLRDLTNVDLWMGVFAEADVDSQGLLMILPSGNVRKRVFVQKDPSNYETITSTSLLDQGNGFSISFSFNENSARSTVNPSVFVTNPVSVPSSQKWLFLGYRGKGGTYRIDGTFLSFKLE